MMAILLPNNDANAKDDIMARAFSLVILVVVSVISTPEVKHMFYNSSFEISEGSIQVGFCSEECKFEPFFNIPQALSIERVNSYLNRMKIYLV